jgi:subtilisin family serine protease
MPEDELSYQYGGNRIALRKVDTARLAVPTKGQNPVVVGARLARSSRLALDASARRHLLVRGDPQKLAEIADYPDIARTRSVLVDPEGNELALTDRVIVSFRDGVGPTERRRIVNQMDALVVEEGPHYSVLQVRDPAEDAPLLTANALAELDRVDYAEPDALQRAVLQGVPTAAAAGPTDQWHLANDGRFGGAAGADVRAPGAWAVTDGSATIRVVVHDSGVDIDHPDLAANIDPGWDFDNDDPDASNDDGPHGTACAGVIAAVRGGTVVGVAPGCRIVPLRAAAGHTWTEWADTIDWAAAHGDVISGSWTISSNETLARAIRRAVGGGRQGRGVACFFATGNDGNAKPAGFPASMPETIGVGASSNLDRLATYSQIGPGIDVVAPSSGGQAGTLRIETTDVTGPKGYSGGDYCRARNATGFGGTSSATPLAAGVAALLLSVDPQLTAADIRQILRATARKIDALVAGYNVQGFSNTHGYGCVDAEQAVLRAQQNLRRVATAGSARSQS